MQLFIRSQTLHAIEVSPTETIAQIKVSPRGVKIRGSPPKFSPFLG